MSAWKLVATAPHQEQVLLGWWQDNGLGGRDWICEVGAASWGWRRGEISNMSRHGDATHWMPIPPPPDAASPDPTTDEALVERVAKAIWDERCKHWGKYRKHLHEPDSEGYDWADLKLSKRKELEREALAAIRAMEEKP